MFGLIGSLIIGALSGWLAGHLVGGKRGLVWDVAVGLIGGFVGERFLGLSMGGGFFGVVITSVIGAVVFLVVFRLLKKLIG